MVSGSKGPTRGYMSEGRSFEMVKTTGMPNASIIFKHKIIYVTLKCMTRASSRSIIAY